MTVLPSRKEVEIGLDVDRDDWRAARVDVIADAYVSGRLVDREAIDRRAAQVAVAEGILDRIAGGDDWEDWADEALALVDLCLAAAIGDTG